jgi:hypothetical protein
LVHLKVKQNNFSQPETIMDCAGKQSLQMSSDSYWTFWPGCVFTEQIYFYFPRHFKNFVKNIGKNGWNAYTCTGRK